MKWLVAILLVVMILAFVSNNYLHLSLLTFTMAAIALMILSKFLGDGTEQLSHNVGQGIAGFINVTLSNISELIIVFMAVKGGLIELVQGGIVGSIIENLLLVMGMSIYFGCKKNGPMKINPRTTSIFIMQLVLSVSILFLPSLFGDRIPADRQTYVSYFLALILVASYFYFFKISLKDEGYKIVKAQSENMNHRWGITKSLAIVASSVIGAFWMSEYLVSEVEHIAPALGLSQTFIGFIILPFLGNGAEHVVAVFAAIRKKTDLSIAIAIGSASQVSMVVAPCAVLFGFLTGHPFNLYFSSMPLGLMVISIVVTYIVMRDNQWNRDEGSLLILLFLAIGVVFAFTQ